MAHLNASTAQTRFNLPDSTCFPGGLCLFRRSAPEPCLAFHLVLCRNMYTEYGAPHNSTTPYGSLFPRPCRAWAVVVCTCVELSFRRLVWKIAQGAMSQPMPSSRQRPQQPKMCQAVFDATLFSSRETKAALTHSLTSYSTRSHIRHRIQ